MSRPFPERIDPGRLVQQGKVVKGQYDLGLLPRLAGLLADDHGEVQFEFEFTRDAGNRPIVRSSVSAELRLICQRCLGPVECRIDAGNTLVLVEGLDEARTVPEAYESLLVEEPTLSVRDMVEEELLLGIPAFPKHDSSCRPDAGQADVSGGRSSPANPFRVLHELKNGSD